MSGSHQQTIRGVFLALGVLGCVVQSLGAGQFEKRIVNRDNDRGSFGTTVVWYTHVISNLPETTVMQAVCRDALLRTHGGTPHCRYLPLSQVGAFGRKKTDLLPYDFTKGAETVVVVDRSALTTRERTALELLQTRVFRALPPAKTAGTYARIWIQNVGQQKNEFQVLVDIADARWLKKVTDDLWAIPDKAVADASRDTLDIEHPIVKTVLLTNDAQVRQTLSTTLRYDDLTVCDLPEFDRYRDAPEVRRRILALHWNGETECTPAMAVQVLPPSLRGECRALMPDRMGVTGWQRFCRKACAQMEQDGRVETWSILAPTATHLRALTGEVVRRRFTGGPYHIDLCDLTHVRSLAVGVYVASQGPERDRLVVQQQLEDAVSRQLRFNVQSMISTQNWGRILQEALGQSQADDPFRRPEDVRRVNQASKSDALLLLWVNTLEPRVQYTFPSQRLTERFPAFSEREPQKPRKPNPNERRFGSDKYLYPGETEDERRNSKAYLRDYDRYEEDYRAYEDDLDEYQDHKSDWEEQRRNYQVNYEYRVVSTPGIGITGFVKVVDTVGDQRILWSAPVLRRQEGAGQIIKTLPVQVRGEDTTPNAPYEIAQFTNRNEWRGCLEAVGADTLYDLGQRALLASLESAVARLPETALWPNDLKPWNRAVRPGATPDGPTPPDPFNIPVTQPQPPVEQPPALTAWRHEGMLMIPLVEFAKWLGAEKTADAAPNMVTLTLGARTVTVKLYSTDAWVDGTAVTMDAPLALHENRAYVPVRFITRAFGLTGTLDPTGAQLTYLHPLTEAVLRLPIL